MSEKQKTYHLMILDKSTSMNFVRDVTISGLNEQLGSIRQAEEDFNDQEQILCFVTFSNDVEMTQVWNKSISEIDDFERADFSPNGMTALYDAIGMGINKLRNQIEDELAERKANVVVTIFTDGQENVSSEFKDPSTVRTLVEEVQNSGQWTVAFVGVGQEDVFTVAQSIGVSRGNTMAVRAGLDGAADAFRSMSNARYARTECYSKSISEGVKTASFNQGENFFANIDLDDDPPQIEDTDVK